MSDERSPAVLLRMEPAEMDRLDAMVDELSKRAGGVKVSRAAVTRLAVDRGLADLEREHARKK